MFLRKDLNSEKAPDTQEADPHSQPGQLKGFYGRARVSVKTLDTIIVLGIIAIFAVLAFGMQHRGFTIEFDSRGGTPVESQTLMYGNLIEEPEAPTREGYNFIGWYIDIYYRNRWNFDTDKVSEPMKMYACWEPKT